MFKAGKQIAVCAVALTALCFVCQLVFFRTFSIYIPLSSAQDASAWQQGVRTEIEHPEVLSLGEPEITGEHVRIRVRPQQAGETSLSIVSADGSLRSFHILRVGKNLVVYDLANSNFTGDATVLLAISIFWLLVSAVMLWHFFQAKGVAFYSYATIYYAGFSLFALVTGVTMLQMSFMHIANPASYSMYTAYSRINSAGKQYMMLTMPFMLVFAAAMALSNIFLLRHERPRLQNGLGILVSVLLVAGEIVGFYIFTRDFSGSEWQSRVDSTLQNTYATVFVYFECMLVGAGICGVKAAKHRPDLDKDFILILGCWFRKDGSLPPLLRGRVDKALAFWHRQKEETGKEAAFIPSGGQGKNESMPEAEAMRRYLLEQNVPEHLILPEARSANTYQNMAFSREIIKAKQPDAKIVFSTTNYHVFRSGVWASLAGLPAEGIGSKTKWWFWPNAFMRETVGLLQNRWKQEALFLVVLIAFFALLTLVL